MFGGSIVVTICDLVECVGGNKPQPNAMTTNSTLRAPECEQWAIVPYKRTPRFMTERLRFPDDDEVTELYNPYAILGLAPVLHTSFDAILDDGSARRRWRQQVENAYLELMRQYHPDVVFRKSNLKQWEIRRSEAICKEITAAYELLSNETRAIQYHLAKDEDNEELASYYYEASRQDAKMFIRQLKGSYQAALASQQLRDLESKDGLIITRAIYGHLDLNALHPCTPLSEILQKFQHTLIDVTAPLQVRVSVDYVPVKNDTSKGRTRPRISLQVPGKTKARQPGFYDVAPQRHKYLIVRYRFGGQLHQVILDDDEPLKIPMRGHALPSPAVDDSDYDDPTPTDPPPTPPRSASTDYTNDCQLDPPKEKSIKNLNSPEKYRKRRPGQKRTNKPPKMHFHSSRVFTTGRQSISGFSQERKNCRKSLHIPSTETIRGRRTSGDTVDPVKSRRRTRAQQFRRYKEKASTHLSFRFSDSESISKFFCLFHFLSATSDLRCQKDVGDISSKILAAPPIVN